MVQHTWWIGSVRCIMQTAHSRISKLKLDVKCNSSCPDRILFLVIVDAHRYSDETWSKGLLRQWYENNGKVTRILPLALQQVTDAHSHSWKRQTNGGCTSRLHPVNIHKSFYSFRFTNSRGIYLTRSCPHLHGNSYKKRQRRMCHSGFPGSRSYRVTFVRDFSRDTLWTSLGSHRHPIYFLRRYKELLWIPLNSFKRRHPLYLLKCNPDFCNFSGW